MFACTSPHFSSIWLYSCTAFFCASSSRVCIWTWTEQIKSADSEFPERSQLRNGLIYVWIGPQEPPTKTKQQCERERREEPHLLGQLPELLRQFAAHVIELPKGLEHNQTEVLHHLRGTK